MKALLGWIPTGFVIAGSATSAGRRAQWGVGGGRWQASLSLCWDPPLAWPERVVCLVAQEMASLRATAAWFLVT